MTMPTKEQWIEIEKELSGVFGRVEITADGFNVVASVQNIAPLKQGIVIYVNGWYRGEWCSGEAEESKKFLQEKRSFVFSAKNREAAKKVLKKRYISKEEKEMWRRMAEDTVSTWSPYWTSPKAFTRHLRKTCTDIEIVKIGGGL